MGAWASVVFDCVLSKAENSVVSGTPPGLKCSYLQIYGKHAKNRPQKKTRKEKYLGCNS